jgi:hypothetical protein
MEPICFAETSVNIYTYTLHNTQQVWRSDWHFGGIPEIINNAKKIKIDTWISAMQ